MKALSGLGIMLIVSIGSSANGKTIKCDRSNTQQPVCAAGFSTRAAGSATPADTFSGTAVVDEKAVRWTCHGADVKLGVNAFRTCSY